MIKILRYMSTGFNTMGAISQWSDFTFTSSKYNAGAFAFNVPLTKQNYDLLKVNFLMYVNDDVNGVILTVSTDLTKRVIKVSGETCNHILATRPTAVIAPFYSCNERSGYTVKESQRTITSTTDYANYLLNFISTDTTKVTRPFPTQHNPIGLERFSYMYLNPDHIDFNLTYSAKSVPITLENQSVLDFIQEYDSKIGVTTRFIIHQNTNGTYNFRFILNNSASVYLDSITDKVTNIVITNSEKDYFNCALVGFNNVDVDKNSATSVEKLRSYYMYLDPDLAPGWPLTFKVASVTGITDVSQRILDDGTKEDYDTWWNRVSVNMQLENSASLSRHNPYNVEFYYEGNKTINLGDTLYLVIHDSEVTEEFYQDEIGTIQYNVECWKGSPKVTRFLEIS